MSVESFLKTDILQLFETADRMQKLVQTRGGDDSLKHKVLATLFYEPSSRTFASFVSAMQRLGGTSIPMQDMTHSSVAKGESLPDTAQVFSSYADVLVIRHPDTGSARELAQHAPVPVINAGDGLGEHPTQAFLDAYTMKKELGRLDNIHIVFVGEFAHYRPVNSLVKLLALFPRIRMSFVSAPEVALQAETRVFLRSKGIVFNEDSKLEDVLQEADVVYITRPKREFVPADVYERIKGLYPINPEAIQNMQRHSVIMHPLPRLAELSVEVDSDPRALYLSKQLKNGLYIRMALLKLMLGRK